MFDVMKNLDFIREKNGIGAGGWKVFFTKIENTKIKVMTGFHKIPKSQRHIIEYVFIINRNRYGIVEAIEKMQEENIFDDFKFQLEESILLDV